MPFSSSPFLNTFSRIYCIQRKKNCKWKSLMLITFFQYCESISLTLCYYLSLSFALLCGGNEASEKKEREAAVVLVTCIRRQGFQICCVICVLGFGGSKLPVMLSSHHRHICSFSGQGPLLSCSIIPNTVSHQCANTWNANCFLKIVWGILFMRYSTNIFKK